MRFKLRKGKYWLSEIELIPNYTQRCAKKWTYFCVLFLKSPPCVNNINFENRSVVFGRNENRQFDPFKLGKYLFNLNNYVYGRVEK